MGRVTRQASVLPFSSMKKQGQYDKVACQSHQYHCLLPLNVQPGIAPDPEAGHAICAGDRKNSPWPFGDGRLGVREEVDQPRLAVECLSLVPIPSLPALSSGRRPLYSLTIFSSGCENSEIAAQPQSIAVVKCFIHIIVAHVLHFVQPSYYTINLTIALVCNMLQTHLSA